MARCSNHSRAKCISRSSRSMKRTASRSGGMISGRATASWQAGSAGWRTVRLLPPLRRQLRRRYRRILQLCSGCVDRIFSSPALHGRICRLSVVTGTDRRKFLRDFVAAAAGSVGHRLYSNPQRSGRSMRGLEQARRLRRANIMADLSDEERADAQETIPF